MIKLLAMARGLAKVSALAAAAVALASCSGGGGGGVSMTPPAPPTGVAYFGNVFAADFNASPNSVPAAVNPGDIIPVSLANYPQSLN